MKKMQEDPDLLEEYDFSQGVQGKYAKRYREGTKTIKQCSLSIVSTK